METLYTINNNLFYSDIPPYNPSVFYPEIANYISKDIGINNIYEDIRKIFIKLELDINNLNKPAWNPLKTFIKKGDHVVLKPNWVFDIRGRKELENSLITHGSFLRVVLDYVVIALKGSGKITICDAPLQSASFEEILAENNLKDIVNIYKDIDINIIDLRMEESILDNSMSKIIDKIKLSGDPMGYRTVNLGMDSFLNELCQNNADLKFGVGDYDHEITNENHRLNSHNYYISGSVLDSDVFINLPKLKAHKKSGITAALKNLVGINGSKAYLVHFSKVGSSNGDEFPKNNIITKIVGYIEYKIKPKVPTYIWGIIRKIWSIYKKFKLKNKENKNSSLLSAGGGWYGNDTIWRMIYDLNSIIFYSDKNGMMQKTQQRKYLSIGDGIISAEGEGPLHGTPVNSNLIIFGDDPISFDACFAELINFDVNKIPIISKYKDIKNYKFSDYNNTDKFQYVVKTNDLKPFEPPYGWRNNIEK